TSLESAAEGGGGARSLGGETHRVGLHPIGGLGLFVEASVLIAHEYVDRTIYPLVGAYDRFLEEGLDELHLGIVHVSADDHGLLDLLDGVGGQCDAETFASKRPPDAGSQTLALPPFVT